jgi:O-antigen/teichoic acid export membrane protein
MSIVSPLEALAPTTTGILRRVVGRALELGHRATTDPLLQKSVLSVFDQAIVSGTSFATSIIIGRICGRSELGVYALALSVVLFARGIQEQLVIAPYMIYCGRRKGAAAASYAGSSLVHQLLILLATCICLAALGATGLGPQLVQPLVGLLLLVAPLLLLREFVRQMSFARLEISAAIATDALIAALQLGGLLLLSRWGMLDVRLALVVMAVSCGLATLVWLVGWRRPVHVTLAAVKSDWRHNWTFSRWALASHLLACSTPLVMPWVVAFTDGEAATGILSACSTLVGLSNMFMMGLANFLSPRAAHAFADGGLPELKSVLRKTGLLFAVTLGAASLGGFVFGEWLATLVYGPSFSGTGAIVGVLATSLLCNSMSVTCGNGLWAMERPNASFRADVISLVVTIVATALLIPPLGTIGAALALLAGTLCDAVVRYWALRSVMREMEARTVTT